MTDELRSLLTDVAEGRVDPAQAAARLSAMDSAAPTPTDPWADATDNATDSSTEQTPPAVEAPSTSASPLRRVVVQCSARPVRVVADPTVATLTVDGPHTVRQDGDTARVEVPVTGSPEGSGGYQFERKSAFSRWISQATYVGVPLTVRLNPDLALEADVMAGSLEVTGLRGPLTFSVTAGSIRADDCSGPFTGTVRAGGAKLDVRPTAGASRVRVESGGVDLRLQQGSDVRLRAHAELGEVKLRGRDGAQTRVVDREGAHELVVGSGTATFDLDVVMGSVKVTTP
jgi:hypothetical protein